MSKYFYRGHKIFLLIVNNNWLRGLARVGLAGDIYMVMSNTTWLRL